MRTDQQRRPETISQREALALALETAERYYDKLNPRMVMDILPPNAPLCLLQKFLKKAIEHSESRKRNLQVWITSVIVLFCYYLRLCTMQ